MEKKQKAKKDPKAKIKNNKNAKNRGKYNTFSGMDMVDGIDGRYQSKILYVMLCEVMNNLLSGLRAVLESFDNYLRTG